MPANYGSLEAGVQAELGSQPGYTSYPTDPSMAAGVPAELGSQPGYTSYPTDASMAAAVQAELGSQPGYTSYSTDASLAAGVQAELGSQPGYSAPPAPDSSGSLDAPADPGAAGGVPAPQHSGDLTPTAPVGSEGTYENAAGYNGLGAPTQDASQTNSWSDPGADLASSATGLDLGGNGTGTGGDAAIGNGIENGNDASAPGADSPGQTASDPGSADPGSADPGSSDPGSSNPGSSNPGSSNPGSSDPGGSDPGSGWPVVLDLTGKGIKITPLFASNTFYDMAGDGHQHRTAWAGAGNGVLVLDIANNGQITQANQVVFTDWDPSAKTDMQALQAVFDTNHDGKLDAGDTDWSLFKIMVTNADVTTSLKTMAQLAITSIGLTPDTTRLALPDGSAIDGETTYTTTTGSGTAADVTLAFDRNGTAVQSTTSTTGTPPNTTTTIDNKAMHADGTRASETITTTAINVNGSTTTTNQTTTYDLNGDGVVDRTQTDTIVAGAGGVTETLSDYSDSNGSGVLLDRTVTTTSASGLVVTISRDSRGTPNPDQQEVQTTYADHSKTDVVTDLNQDGSTKDKTSTSVSADGLVGTTSRYMDASANPYLVTVATIVDNGDGSRDDTVDTKAQNGTLLYGADTHTSPDGQTTSIAGRRPVA